MFDIWIKLPVVTNIWLKECWYIYHSTEPEDMAIRWILVLYRSRQFFFYLSFICLPLIELIISWREVWWYSGAVLYWSVTAGPGLIKYLYLNYTSKTWQLKRWSRLFVFCLIITCIINHLLWTHICLLWTDVLEVRYIVVVDLRFITFLVVSFTSVIQLVINIFSLYLNWFSSVTKKK